MRPKVWQAKLRVLERDGEAQTRRVIKPQPIDKPVQDAYGWWHWVDSKGIGYDKKSRYQVGETAYVKEAWYAERRFDHLKPRDIPLLSLVGYPARDIRPDWAGKLRSPMFLRMEFARYFPTITGIKIERVQEITEEDCLAEGISKDVTCYIKDIGKDTEERTTNPREAFRWLWNSIYAKWKRVYNKDLRIYKFWQFPWSEEDAKPIPKTTKHPERYHCCPNPYIFAYTFILKKEK